MNFCVWNGVLEHHLEPGNSSHEGEIMQKNIRSFIIGGFVASSLGALAVNIPNTFNAGQPIKASEINANFSALKTAVDALEVSPLKLPASLEGTNPTVGSALLKVSTKNIGTAIHGISNDPDEINAPAGVQGDTVSPGGFGVYGLSRVNGRGTGVYGQGGIGVYGRTTNQTTTGYGVYGESLEGEGYGVFGKSVGVAGVHGETSKADGSGVEGKADGRYAAGVYGINPKGPGVWGRSTDNSGVYGENTSGNGSGVEGNGNGNNAAGVYGVNPNGPGVWGKSTIGSGVYGQSTGGYGGYFRSQSGSAIVAETVSISGYIFRGLVQDQSKFSVEATGDVKTVGQYFGQAFNNTSDRNAKQNFSSVNALGILEKVVSLPITRWNYKTDVSSVEHVGPMAQDFHAAFGLNGSDDKHISSIDAQGVALAAIQGLNTKLEAQNTRLETENAKMRAALVDLGARIAKLERR